MSIKGLTVHKVLVGPGGGYRIGAYVGIIVDRKSRRAVFMVSREGGIDIEEVAARNPGAITASLWTRLWSVFRSRRMSSRPMYDDFKRTCGAKTCSSSTRSLWTRGVAGRDQPRWLPRRAVSEGCSTRDQHR